VEILSLLKAIFSHFARIAQKTQANFGEKHFPNLKLPGGQGKKGRV
jgi:hypothetical protein